MKITNNLNLPAGMVRAALSHEHKGEDYSASMLGNPAQIVTLEARHKEEIVEDVADMIYRLLGLAWHKVAEMGADPETEIPERYLVREIGGVKISGQCDIYNRPHKKVQDYKVLSVWSKVFPGRIEEYHGQLNTYAWQTELEKTDNEVKELEIVALYRDWQKKQAGVGKYPKFQVEVIPIPLWETKKTEEWIKGRVSLFESCKKLDDANLPPCSEEERWKDNERCKAYCKVAPFCHQFKGGK